jgi:ABC-type Mn2+/Zn2+ transport system permease subunit
MAVGLIEVLLLATAGGLLGAQVVLRQIAFFAHGVGAATFPGIVAAGALGAPAPAGALVAGLAFAGSVGGLRGRLRLASDAAIALALVGSLALGVLLADALHSGVSQEEALVGAVGPASAGELARMAVASALAVAAVAALGRVWVATAFDPESSRALGARARVAEPALLAVLAVVAVSAVDAVGALLAGALIVVPAATALLVARSVRELSIGAVAVAAVEGVVALSAARALGLPPGPALATVAGAIFVLVALGRALARAAVPPDRHGARGWRTSAEH